MSTKKCSTCGGGIYRGQHYPGCPKNISAKNAPSLAGYGVFLHSSGNSGYVTRAMDTLQAPYHTMKPVRVFKRRADADKLADKLNEGVYGSRRRNSRGRFTRA